MYCSRCGPRTSLTYDKRPGYLSNITTNIHTIVKMEGNRFAKHISEFYSRIFNCNSQLSRRVSITFSVRLFFLWDISLLSISFSTNVLNFFMMNNQCKCFVLFSFKLHKHMWWVYNRSSSLHVRIKPTYTNHNLSQSIPFQVDRIGFS